MPRPLKYYLQSTNGDYPKVADKLKQKYFNYILTYIIVNFIISTTYSRIIIYLWTNRNVGIYYILIGGG